MGVPYKLERKIVEFIIIQKRTNPKLGCRDFVDIIKEKFGLIISKSTVNAVIKEAGLSRPVGRPRTAPKPEAPKPKEKQRPSKPKETLKALPKQELVLLIEKKEKKPPVPSEVSKEKLPKKEEKPIVLPAEEFPEKPELPLEAKAERAKELLKPEAAEPAPKPEASKEEKPKELPKPEKKKPEGFLPERQIGLPQIQITKPDKVERIIEEASVQKIIKAMKPVEIKEDEILDCMGIFFLKAAELEISQTSILGNLVREFFPKIEAINSEIISNTLLYLTVFGIESLELIDTYDKQGLWIFSNTTEKVNYSQLNSFFQELQAKKDLVSGLYDECEKSFKEAHYFKFILQNGTIFYIDARLKSIWEESNIPDNFTVSFNKANNYIKEKFVRVFSKETQPLLLFNVPRFRAFSPIVSEFVSAFEDISRQRITEIDIFSAHNQELESYNNIVPARRMFVFGFWPWQKETQQFLKGDIGVVKDFYFSELARQIYYTESAVEFPKDSAIKLNLIFIKNSAFSSPRMGILTNVPNQTMPVEEVIKLYLKSWPNFEDTYQDLMASSERLTYRGFVYPVFDEEKEPRKEKVYVKPASRTELNNILKTLLTNLSTASQRHFFPYGYRFADFSIMKQRFYSLPGKLKRKDNNLFINLIPPKDYPFSNDLFYAVRRVNESDIRDIFGCKIWFKVL